MSPERCGARVVVAVQNATRAAVPPAADLRRWVRHALGPDAAGEVAVRLVDEPESAALNLRYRNKPGATNVLAFPAGDAAGAVVFPVPLGDLVVCAPVVAREAGEQGKSEVEHWAHIVIHGSLHLAGFDHESDTEAETMERRERELLAGLGIGNPYAAETGR